MKAIYVFLIGVVIGVWLRRQSEPGYVMHLEPLPEPGMDVMTWTAGPETLTWKPDWTWRPGTVTWTSPN